MSSKKVLDVTIVLLEAGYASTAIGPIEVFHSAGTLWNWLQGEPPQPRFRVRTVSIDGESVASICTLGLMPERSIHDVEHTDIIILSAPGWDVLDHIARHTSLLPWLRKWHSRGAYIAGICTGVAFLALQTGAPVVPVGLIGTDKVMPVGAKMPTISERITVKFGEPLDLSPHGAATSGRARRLATDDIMAAIHALSGQELAGSYNEAPAQGTIEKIKQALPHERR
jgi:hypothetical protein